MEEKQLPRGRVAMRVAMVVLAVLLLCQAISPMVRGLDERRKVDASAAASERRLGNPMVSPLGGRGGVMKGKPGTMKGHNPQGGVGNPLNAAAAARSKGMMGRGPVRSTPTEVLDTVDFTAREGLLWHPISMRSVVCPAGEEDCDAVVRFCLIRIAEYQENPWKYPMAAMLQKMSQCQSPENSRAYRLSTLRAYVREHPDDFLQPSGFVYHETRTGSTLVANMLAHVPSNLVVSENSLAEEAARRCPQCTPQQRVRLSREMLLLLGNAKGGHTHLFFKFQDSTTLSVMTEAFPDVAWVFLFRDPVEVMVSNLKGAYGKRERFYKGIDFDAADNATANSLLERPKLRSAKPMLSPCLLSGGVDTKGKPREEICATRLKVLCQSAVTALAAGRKGAGRGAVVEYPNLPDVVEGFIYPELFGMGSEMLEEHLPHMSEAARMYSKSMANPESKFAVGMDASYKHVMAEKAYQEAAESTGLAGVYRELLGLQAWRKTAP